MRARMGTSLSYTSRMIETIEAKTAGCYHVVTGMPKRARYEADHGWSHLLTAPSAESGAEAQVIRRGATAHGPVAISPAAAEADWLAYVDPSDIAVNEGEKPMV
jgi:hypothetical protein